MGKNKRQKLGSQPQKMGKNKLSGKGARPTGITKAQPSKSSKPGAKHAQQRHSMPTLPFSPDERILLIGEGDLSFARSLVEHHCCAHITATVYESEAELKKKYPQAEENISAVEAGGGVVVYGVDATKMKPWLEGKNKPGVMDRIFFNFPHVGGKSTDVNRQVRYNQELLVSFFKQGIPSLSPKHGSSIIVTLFDGEPYTLWNIRDLGRHSNLQVAESFKFQAKAYPGYKHARTLGVIKGKNGEAGGGWKGEQRPARSYVFVRKGEGIVMGEAKKKGDEGSEEAADEEGFEDEDENDNEDGHEMEEDETDDAGIDLTSYSTGHD